MALALPITTDLLSSPDHSLLHRIIAVDLLAPEQTVVVIQSGVLQTKVGMAIRDSSTSYYTTIQGGVQAGELTYTLPTGYPAVTGYALISTDAGVMSWGAAGAVATRATFVNGDLSAGVLTVTHNKALSAPYGVLVQVFDNNGKMIVPDEVTGAANSFAIDLTSYGTLTGTWGYVYIA